jgi:hypothetical protein
LEVVFGLDLPVRRLEKCWQISLSPFLGIYPG